MNSPSEEMQSVASRCMLAGEGTEKLSTKEISQLLYDCSRWLSFASGALLGKHWINK